VRAARQPGKEYLLYTCWVAENVNGLYKAEVIDRQGPWRSLEQVELATAGLGPLVE
jgi:hypothetical protein